MRRLVGLPAGGHGLCQDTNTASRWWWWWRRADVWVRLVQLTHPDGRWTPELNPHISAASSGTCRQNVSPWTTSPAPCPSDLWGETDWVHFTCFITNMTAGRHNYNKHNSGLDNKKILFQLKKVKHQMLMTNRCLELYKTSEFKLLKTLILIRYFLKRLKKASKLVQTW